MCRENRQIFSLSIVKGKLKEAYRSISIRDFSWDGNGYRFVTRKRVNRPIWEKFMRRGSSQDLQQNRHLRWYESCPINSEPSRCIHCKIEVQVYVTAVSDRFTRSCRVNQCMELRFEEDIRLGGVRCAGVDPLGTLVSQNRGVEATLEGPKWIAGADGG